MVEVRAHQKPPPGGASVWSAVLPANNVGRAPEPSSRQGDYRAQGPSWSSQPVPIRPAHCRPCGGDNQYYRRPATPVSEKTRPPRRLNRSNPAPSGTATHNSFRVKQLTSQTRPMMPHWPQPLPSRPSRFSGGGGPSAETRRSQRPRAAGPPGRNASRPRSSRDHGLRPCPSARPWRRLPPAPS